MEVWLAIVVAALVGGVVFMLLERWQRSPAQPALADRPIETTAPIWVPEPQTYSSWAPPSAEAETRPLAPEPVWEREPQPELRRETPRLWTPPPSRTGHWDDDDRHRDEDDDDRPPGLWSGWANR
jgi:hypothetical protein